MIIKSEEPVSFAIRLKQVMKERNVSQNQLSLACKINKNTIGSWLRGDKPVRINDKYGNKLERIAKYLHVDVGYLKCEQVEKRRIDHKPDFSKFNAEIDVEELRKGVAFIEYIEKIGIEVKESMENADVDEVEDSFIQDGKLITISDTFCIPREFRLIIDGNETLFTEMEFNILIKESEKIIRILCKKGAKE